MPIGTRLKARQTLRFLQLPDACMYIPPSDVATAGVYRSSSVSCFEPRLPSAQSAAITQSDALQSGHALCCWLTGRLDVQKAGGLGSLPRVA